MPDLLLTLAADALGAAFAALAVAAVRKLVAVMTTAAHRASERAAGIVS